MVEDTHKSTQMYLHKKRQKKCTRVAKAAKYMPKSCRKVQTRDRKDPRQKCLYRWDDTMVSSGTHQEKKGTMLYSLSWHEPALATVARTTSSSQIS